ncbi:MULTISPECIES: rhomboid family intramembrane serine protease [unclassified Haladaptatus]|uniref:rhomboid family intramembrane serine protease n=1 Tax=unclassified Haladaptatus TaxID=2622732 RepID=UPI0023E8D45B|nr:MULTISPECIES: rhomboid family intramembrane serine protease [unclassified Haladaptatus]
MVSVPSGLPLWQLAIALAVLVSFVAVWLLDRPNGRWGATLRKRFVLGVPWGTLLVILGVLAVYLFVQRGIDDWYNPLVIPFRAWSYLYPLGLVAAPFSHANSGHLMGNLIGTLALAPLAEYAWSHYPTKRGTQTFTSLRTNPFARILAFVVAVTVVGIFTGLFALGPVIGFSGVVFAFAGFALVRYPLSTIIALSVSSVFSLIYNALRMPVLEAQAGPSFQSPWWASIAIQGHALGLFAGVVLGVLLLRRRSVRPNALRLWLGALLFSVGQGLWAVYWFRGSETFVLYRALGTALVFALAVLIAAGVTASDRPLVGNIDLSRWETAAGLLVLGLLLISVPTVPVNFTTVDDATAPGMNPVDVRDYSISYAEDVPNQMVSAVNISAFNETTRVNTSGVIVISEERHIWTTAVTSGRLAFSGQETVRVGGVGWQETVTVTRDGWTVAGNSAVYKIHLQRGGADKVLAFTSDESRADLTVSNRNITFTPSRTGYDVIVTRGNDTLERALLPAPNESVAVGGLDFRRTDDKIYVSDNGTRIQVAARETYNR